MTPMTLERALEVAIDELTDAAKWADDAGEAAATLREFMEKGLPFYRAAEVIGEKRSKMDYKKRDSWGEFDNLYRAMKEGK